MTTVRAVRGSSKTYAIPQKNPKKNKDSIPKRILEAFKSHAKAKRENDRREHSGSLHRHHGQGSTEEVFFKTFKPNSLSDLEAMTQAVKKNKQYEMLPLLRQANNAELLVHDTLTLLRDDPKAKQGLQNVREAYFQYTVQKAIDRNDVDILQLPFARKIGLEEISVESIVQALKELDTSRARCIAAEIESISTIPFTYHKLEPIEMLVICMVGMDQLGALGAKAQVVYKRAQDLQISRCLVIDTKRRNFTILSKKHGSLQAEGTFKKVTDAIEVNPSNESASARRIVRMVTKEDERVTDRELEFENRYGKILSWTRYEAKKRPFETKTLLLQEAYDTDLYLFTPYSSSRNSKKMPFNELVKVLSDVGATLQEMHQHDVVHHDFKVKNVLYRKTSEGEVQAKLIDFGHSYRPDKTNYPKKRKKGYGTLRYTSPDTLEDPKCKHDPFFLAKADDMYALGCLIYEVHLYKETPWGEYTYKALKYGKDTDKYRQRALKLQKETHHNLEEEAYRAPQTAEKELLRICSRLLDPNPLKRMQTAEFMSALQGLQFKLSTYR